MLFCVFPLFVQASSTEFNIDSSYDISGRSKVEAFLHQVGERADFYVEEDFYQTLNIEKRQEFSESLKNLSQEFDNIIYPELTKIYGSEWKPGIDANEKITVLITQIKEESGGYFNPADEYFKAETPNSNEREMVYFNAKYITSILAKSYLTHEFTHLISFNQKERAYGVSEEVWLNEARAEMASTLLGYDDDYEGSNLQKRVLTFIQKPEDSLTEWKNTNFDYGVLNIFFQYLLDHYGQKILIDSLYSNKTGINSLNYALNKNGWNQDFSQIFTDWTIAVLINDCSVGQKYCYLNPHLKNLRVLPQLNYLPMAGESILTMADYTKNWAGNWYKFIGGKGTLKLEFQGEKGVSFRAPYLTRDAQAQYAVSFLILDVQQKGVVSIDNFGENYKSFIIVPSIQDKTSGFGSSENYYSFSWVASISSNSSGKEEEVLIQRLLSQIEYLKSEIAKTQAKINELLTKQGSQTFCPKLENNLYFGLKDNLGVKCLQEFLKKQGPDIYPEGLVTGNFFTLTQEAVKKYQAKKGISPTGFVGPLTRAAINQE